MACGCAGGLNVSSKAPPASSVDVPECAGARQLGRHVYVKPKWVR